MKKLTILLLLLVLSLGSNIHAQETKYVVVPIQFDFLKGRDQFRANSLLRYLFKENGYKAYFDVEDLPEDLFQDRCKAIYSDVKKIGGGLNIKVQIEIKDCRGNLLFLSDIGKSKEKDLNKGYKLAIEEAFESFKAVNVTSEADELDVLIAQEEKTAHEQQGQVTGINKTTGGVATTATATKTLNPSVTSNTEANSNETLFAKPSEDGGYQVFTMEPKVVMELEKSDIKDVYRVKGEEAILFKRGSLWVYAKTVDGKTVEKTYTIKF